MLHGIPKYCPKVQSGITLATCILENIAHSACETPQSTPCDVGEDDPWSPMSFTSMSAFRDFLANAMWQQYQTARYAMEYPDSDADDEDDEDNEDEDIIAVKEEPEDEVTVTHPFIVGVDADSAETEVNDVEGNGGSVPETPTSPPNTFKVFIEQLFDFPPSQPPDAYVHTPSPMSNAAEDKATNHSPA